MPTSAGRAVKKNPGKNSSPPASSSSGHLPRLLFRPTRRTPERRPDDSAARAGGAGPTHPRPQRREQEHTMRKITAHLAMGIMAASLAVAAVAVGVAKAAEKKISPKDLPEKVAQSVNA